MKTLFLGKLNHCYCVLKGPEMNNKSSIFQLCLLLFLLIPVPAFSDLIPYHTFTGTSHNERLGHSVALIGDIDGDNISDLILSAPFKTIVDDNVGQVYVYSGAEFELMYTLNGAFEGHLFGRTVACAGDVNNDDVPDFIIGAPYFSIQSEGSDPGRAYVFSGINGDTLYSFIGENSDDEFGRDVATAGDINQDGFDDFIITAQANDAGGNQAGRAYVFSGIDGDTLFVFTGSFPIGFFGISAAPAGDVNNDNIPDIIIGAGREHNYKGNVYVYSGDDGELLHKFSGENTGDWFGLAVSSAGDADKDGFDDILIGAQFNADRGLRAGKAYVFSGQTGQLLFQFYGKIEAGLGRSVGLAGDVNGDSFDDYVLGAIGGSTKIYSGYNGGLINSIEAPVGASLFGESVSSAGDQNGDGRADIFIGADASNIGGFHAGQAFVYVDIPCCEGLRGDIDLDGIDADPMDLVYIVNWIFKLGADPLCLEEADLNNDGNADVLDLNWIVNYLYRKGPAPYGCTDTTP